LLTLFENPMVLVLEMFALCLATLATNIAANVVGPASDFAHLRPKSISCRVGGLITGLIGILMQPWRLKENAAVYIDKWLISYSLLLRACGGVLIADYYLIRRRRLDLAGLTAAMDRTDIAVAGIGSHSSSSRLERSLPAQLSCSDRVARRRWLLVSLYEYA
jgi:cytosine/uracil/thiamine/allantoin permease